MKAAVFKKTGDKRIREIRMGEALLGVGFDTLEIDYDEIVNNCESKTTLQCRKDYLFETLFLRMMPGGKITINFKKRK